MSEKKRFQKQTLNNEDYQGMENGAKAIKGFFGAVAACVTLYVNKDNLKTLATNLPKLAVKIIKK